MDALPKRNKDHRMDQSVDRKREHEKQLVAQMITLYCNKKHGTPKGERCAECAELESYARTRADRCPFMESKTFCANCKVHCYKPDMREKIREVMRFAGPRMILTNPLIVVQHLIDTHKRKMKQFKENA